MTLDRMTVEIQADTSQLKQGLNDAKRDVKSFASSTELSVEQIKTGSKQASAAVKNLISGIGSLSRGNAATGVSQLATGFQSASVAAKTLNLSLTTMTGLLGKVVLSVAPVLAAFVAVGAVIASAVKGVKDLAIYDKSLGNTMGINKAMSNIATSWDKLTFQMEATFGTILADIIKLIEPVITAILKAVTKVIEGISYLYAVITGKSEYTIANPDYWNDYAESANKASKAQKKLISGLDELNRLDAKSNSDTSATDIFDTKEINPEDTLVKWRNSIAEFVDWLKEKILKIIELIQQIIDWINDQLKKLEDDNPFNDFDPVAWIPMVPDDFWDNFKTNLQACGVAVKEFCAGFVEGFREAYKTVNGFEWYPSLDPVLEKVKNFQEQLKQIGDTVVKPVIDVVISMLPTWEDIKARLTELAAVPVMVTVTLALKGYETVKNALIEAKEYATQLATNAWAMTVTVALVGYELVKEQITELFQSAKQVATETGKALQTAWTEAKTGVETTSAEILATVISSAQSAYNYVKQNGELALTAVTVSGVAIVAVVASKMLQIKTDTASGLVAVQSSFTATIAAIGVTLATYSANVRTYITETMTSMSTYCSQVQTKVTQAMAQLQTSISTGLATAKQNLQTWSTNTVSLLSTWKTNAVNAVSGFKTAFVQAIQNGLDAAMTKITTWASNALAKIKSVWSEMTSSSSYGGAYTSSSYGYRNSAYSESSSSSKSTSSSSSAVGSTSWWSTFKNWASASSSEVSLFKQALNKESSSKSNQILQYLNAMMIPSTSAAASSSVSALSAIKSYMSSNTTIAQLLQYLKQLVPVGAFANGGVITQPTLGLVGEYAGANSNPEIITPTSLMKEVIDSSNNDLANVYISVGRQIIAAIENQSLEVSIGDDVIAKSAAKGNRNYYKMTGQSLFAM